MSEKTLAGVFLFDALDEAERQKIERLCAWRWVKSGQQIVRAGSPSREVFFVIEGRAQVVNFSLSGKEIAFASLSAGDCFGELAALDGNPRSASVVAAEKTFLAVLPSSHFIDLLQRRVEVTFKVLDGLARMVRSGDSRIMELSTLAASQRVYAEILRMAVRDTAVPDLWVVRPLPPLREIASRVSTTRETVARAMGQIYASGLVKRKGRNLYLMDREQLESKIDDLKVAVADSLPS
ncbi:MAG: Crp/Fnr family transcriptional regulator [Pseudomonadota bacterium]